MIMMDTENLSPSSSSSGGTFTSSSPPSYPFPNYQSYLSTMSTTNGLPRQFVKSMRTLFNILDDSGSGLVPLVEFERRWREDAVPNLPGVVDALRAVAPTDGLLSFDNFVCGLRVALTRSRRKDTVHQQLHRIGHYRGERSGPISNMSTHSFMPHSPLERAQVDFNKVATVHPSYARDNNYVHCKGDRQLPTAMPLQTHNSNLGYQKPSERSGRAVRSNRRRSNSGPITTAKVLPNIKPLATPYECQTHDDIEVEKSNCRSNYFRQRIHDNCRESNPTGFTHHNELTVSEDEKKSDEMDFTSMPKQPNQIHDEDRQKTIIDSFNKDVRRPGQEKFCKNDLDQITANTLFINKDEDPSKVAMKPISLSGKYIGITGTLKRSKSSTSSNANQFGTLKKDDLGANNKGNPPLVTSVSATCFGSLGKSAVSSRNAKIVMSKKMNRIHSGKSDSDILNGISNADRKRAIEKRSGKCGYHWLSEQNGGNGRDGTGRRCNSASPPERPVVKSARGSNSPDALTLPRLALSSPESVVSRTTTSPVNASNHSSLQQTHMTSGERNLASATAIPTIIREEKGNSTSSNITGIAAERRRRANSAGSASRKRDTRRHTVTNGIDYNIIKSMKQLEQEKDLLLQGLDEMNRSQNWFQRKISEVQKRQNQLNSDIKSSSMSLSKASSHSENNYSNEAKNLWCTPEIEVRQRRIDALVTTVSELAKMSKKLIQDNVLIAKQTLPNQELKNDAVRDQNQLLTKEVALKSELISQLEKEKSVLVQQLFQARAEIQNAGGQVNTSIFI